MTAPANPAMIDGLDTFYKHIVDNYAYINSKRKLKGIVNASDWPQTQIEEGALYLIYLTSVPILEDGSRSVTYYEHFVQWAWIYIGDDLKSTERGANRGNRYRDSMAIIEELRQVHFPGFCNKKYSSCDASGTITFEDYSPVESVHWSQPRMGMKLANVQSGVAYSTAPIEVYAWSTVNPLVNA